VAGSREAIAEAVVEHERNHASRGIRAEITVYRLPWGMPPPLLTPGEDEHVVGEAVSRTTLVTLTNRRVLVTRPWVSREWTYEDIEHVYGGELHLAIATGENDPDDGLLIWSWGTVSMFSMSWKEARWAAEKIQGRLGPRPPHPRLWKRTGIAEEWRVGILFQDVSGSGSRTRKRFVRELRPTLSEDVTISHEGSQIFLYSSTEAPAREALQTTQAAIEQEGLVATTALERWDPVELEWQGQPDG